MSDLARRAAALTLPVRLLSRLVGRNEAHSSKNDEMRARADLAEVIASALDCVPVGMGYWPTVRDARAALAALTLSPGSPGVVQKGERT